VRVLQRSGQSLHLLGCIYIYIQVLRDYIFSRQPSLEELLRHVAREELAQYTTD
jgi:hypothetical protein